jgi:hypothetical protein
VDWALAVILIAVFAAVAFNCRRVARTIYEFKAALKDLDDIFWS